jgi:hypothetical protein
MLSIKSDPYSATFRILEPNPPEFINNDNTDTLLIKEEFRTLFGNNLVDKYELVRKEHLGVPQDKEITDKNIIKSKIHQHKAAYGIDNGKKFIAMLYAPLDDLEYGKAKVELIIQEIADDDTSFTATVDGPFQGKLDDEKLETLKNLFTGSPTGFETDNKVYKLF